MTTSTRQSTSAAAARGGRSALLVAGLIATSLAGAACGSTIEAPLAGEADDDGGAWNGGSHSDTLGAWSSDGGGGADSTASSGADAGIDSSSDGSGDGGDAGAVGARADAGAPAADAGHVLPPRCRTGERRYGNSCYWTDSRTLRTYDEASGLCVARAAHVVTIETSGEDRFVYGLVPSWSQAVWIGLIRVPGTKRFAWRDGSSAAYRNWDSGEPNNQHGIEDCALIWGPAIIYPSRRKHWNDAPCRAVPRETVVCERELP